MTLPAPRAGTNADRDESALTGYTTVAVIVFLTFLLRWVLAGRNSYWLDELYSVERFTLRHDSIIDMARDLSTASIHPPLYQAVLFVWIKIFGDTETVTRMLSNVYVTVGVVFTYLWAARFFGRSIGTLSALAFAISYPAIYYGLETRSYAQTLMLATVAAYALTRYLERFQGHDPGRAWRRRAWAPALLCGANLGLLLTHYYNFFFWGAQVLFVAIFLLVVSQRARVLRNLVSVGSLYLLQLVAFFLIWGRITLDAYDRVSSGRFSTETVMYTPVEILRRIADHIFSFGPVPAMAGLLLMAGAVAWFAADLLPRRRESDARRQLTGLAHATALTLGPAVVGYGVFLVASAERLNDRYLIYMLPGFVLLMALALRQIATKLAGLAGRVQRSSEGIALRRLAAGGTAVMVVGLVLPGAVRASTQPKADWRGIAGDVAAVVDSNDAASYIVYETGFRSTSMLTYYLRRHDDSLQVAGIIQRYQERGDRTFRFEKDAATLEEHDYLIVTFTHHSTQDFPNALRKLRSRYPVHHAQLDASGRGYIVFGVGDGTRVSGTAASGAGPLRDVS